MSIRREDVHARAVDFSEVASGGELPAIHPGEILCEEFLTPLGISVPALANALKIAPTGADAVTRGQSAVTAEMAMRLGRYFGTSPEFWMNLQTRYDLDVADRMLRSRIEQEVAPRS